MKTKLTTLRNGNRTDAVRQWVSGRKPVLGPLVPLLFASALLLAALRAQAGVVFSTLYSFQQLFPDGADLRAGLVEGTDGNFYGTTAGCSTGPNFGTVFKISTSEAYATFYSFGDGNDGTGPDGLVQGSDGNFYGTTEGGTVFRLTVVPAAPAFQAVPLTNSMLSLIWSTEVGGTYQLQYNSDLSSSNWANIGSAIAADGTTLSALDSVPNGPRRFYRVVLLQ
jgi:hypothetical protein